MVTSAVILLLSGAYIVLGLQKGNWYVVSVGIVLYLVGYYLYRKALVRNGAR